MMLMLLARRRAAYIYQGMPDAMEPRRPGRRGRQSPEARPPAPQPPRQQTRRVRFKIWDAGYQASVTALREAMWWSEIADRACAEAALSTDDAYATTCRGSKATGPAGG